MPSTQDRPLWDYCHYSPFPFLKQPNILRYGYWCLRSTKSTAWSSKVLDIYSYYLHFLGSVLFTGLLLILIAGYALVTLSLRILNVIEYPIPAIEMKFTSLFFIIANLGLSSNALNLPRQTVNESMGSFRIWGAPGCANDEEGARSLDQCTMNECLQFGTNVQSITLDNIAKGYLTICMSECW